MSSPFETLSEHSPTMDQQSDRQPDEGLPQVAGNLVMPLVASYGSRETAGYSVMPPVAISGSRESAGYLVMPLVASSGSRETAGYLVMPPVYELKKLFKEGEASWNLNLDFLGLEKIERIGGVPPAFYSHFWNEDIADMPTLDLYALLKEKSLPNALRDKIVGELAVRDIANMPTLDLHALMKEKSLPNTLRDKIMGELAVRIIAKVNGKGLATSSYDTGESSANTSSLNSPIREEISQRSDRNDYAGAGAGAGAGASANANRGSLNGHTKGTVVTLSRGSPESIVQHYLLRHPLPASRNEAAHLQESNAKCKDNHNVGRAGTTVFSSEPIAYYQQPAAYAPSDADIEAGRAGTTVFSSEPIAHCQQPTAYALASTDIEAGRARTTVFSLEPTAHYQHSAPNAPSGADIKAGSFTICSEPPPEAIAILNESVAELLITGAFTLLSMNSETFRGPVERVLLGVMTVGFVSNFMWRLMGGRRRMVGVSSLLQWTAVWAMFVAFFLIMALLITH